MRARAHRLREPRVEDRRAALVLVALVAGALALALSRPPHAHAPVAARSPAPHAPSRHAGVSVRRALAVCRVFLAGYLPYSEGLAPASAIKDAAPGLIAEFDTTRTHSEAPGRARLLALEAAISAGGQLVVSVTAGDGSIVRYGFAVRLALERGRLLVTGVESEQ